MTQSAEKQIINIYEATEAKAFTSSFGFTIPYRIYMPADYTAEKKYPLLVFLHGAGERGDDNRSQLFNMVPSLYERGVSPLYEAIAIFPQCPAEMQWVNTPWKDGDYRIDEIPQSKPLGTVYELLLSLKSSLSVDESRIYAMGISMGGYGTWDLILRHTELFAAAIPVCGAGDSTKASRLKDLPIRTFHGTEDTVVPPHGTETMMEALAAVGSTNASYEPALGWAHDSWDYAAAKDGLIDWLFAQTK